MENKKFIFKFEYTIEIEAENEEKSYNKLKEQLESMDWEEAQEFTTADNWELQ